MLDPESASTSGADRAPHTVPGHFESHGDRVRYWSFVALAIGLGIALRAAALHGSLLGDDWDHYAMWAGAYPVPRSALDMFNFIGSGPAERLALMHSGRLPWWSDPGIQLSFLRPLPSALAYFDYAVLGPAASASHHWHTAFWWALTVVALAGVLRRSVPRPVAVLAILLYVVDDAHALPVAWSANRGELVAVASMFGALWAHLDWTQRRRARSRLISVALVCCGMLSGEYALALFGFFVAHALCAERAPARLRLRRLAPLTLPIVVYLIARSWLGYGTAGSSFYVDPVRDPVRYLISSLARVPMLLADLIFGYPAEWWYGDPPWRSRVVHAFGGMPDAWLTPAHVHEVQLGLGGLGLALASLGLFQLIRRSSQGAHHPLVWLLGGALLGLLPLCGVLPMSRLCIGPSLGFHTALAWLVVRAARAVVGRDAIVERVLAGILVAGVCGVHGVYAATRSRSETLQYALRARTEEAWVEHAEIDANGLPARHIIILSARDLASQFSLPFVRRLHGSSAPASSELLLPAWDGPLEVTRIADNVLDIRAVRSSDSAAFRTSAYRLDASDFHQRQVFPGDSFTVVVMAVEHGNPTQLRFAFRKPLGDRSYLFLYPVASGLQALRLPPVASAVRLGPPAWPSASRAALED
jgi:hypothetical protein